MRASTTLAGASANQARALAPSWFLGALAGLLLKQAAKNLAEMANPGVLQVVQALPLVKLGAPTGRRPPHHVLTGSPANRRFPADTLSLLASHP